MKKTLALFAGVSLAVLIAPSTWAATAGNETEGPGSARHQQLKKAAAKAAGQRGGPTTASCGLSTPDFVVTGAESRLFDDEHCFPSNGTGVFGPRSTLPLLGIVDGMDVADMDNDGDNDFLACMGLPGEVYLYTQDPANVFVPKLVAQNITSGVGGSIFCTNLREADFNGDGLKDFVVGDNRVTKGMNVYLQGPVGNFDPVNPGLDLGWASPAGVPCNCIFGVAAGDVDGDDNDDVVVLGYRGAGAGQVWFYQGNGAGGMAAPVLLFNVSIDFPVVANPTGLALFDVEGDGDQDLLVGGSFDGSHYVYTNNGLGNYIAPAGPALTTGNWSGADAFDVDGDMREDVMMVNWSSASLLYSQNMGGALAAPAVVGALDGPSIGIGAPERVEEEGFGLDHFKCYKSEAERPIDEEVELKDQFNSGPAKVLKSLRFCTSVEKTHRGVVTSILDKDAHLEFYSIEAEGRTPSLVEVSNQFGPGQKLEVGKALALAVPTQKIEPGNHPFPKKLDHFKCYEVFGEHDGATVGLTDQFGKEPSLRAFEPRLLCNPTEKVHKRRLTKIQNPMDHLVCYQLEGTRPLVDFSVVENQFAGGTLRLDAADLLCLPSKKKVIQ